MRHKLSNYELFRICQPQVPLRRGNGVLDYSHCFLLAH